VSTAALSLSRPRPRPSVRGALVDPLEIACERLRVSDDVIADLFRKHGPMVYRRALRLLGGKADAEEALHEVFIRVMRRIDDFEGKSQVTTWLYEITTNYCLNQLRDQARRRQLLAEHLPAPDEVAAGADPVALVLLRRILAESDEREARAAVYVLLDGLSQEEAAAQLGVSQRTVSNLVDRFLRRARARAGAEASSERPAGPTRTRKEAP
jgi:RNA polymerase sigma-70 factor (ECF subfamily)